MSVKYRIILSFGSNQGSREDNLTTALKYLYSNDPSFNVNKQSAFVSNLPFEISTSSTTSHLASHTTSQNSSKDSSEHSSEHSLQYLNFIADCSTKLHPLNFYQNIIVPLEDLLGHSRTQKWAPRHLDIDILLAALDDATEFYNCSSLILQSEFFHVPHKRLLDSERKILQDLLQETLDLTFERIQCHFTQTLCEKN